MKIKYLKLKNWLLVSLAGLLGITVGCGKEPEDMYGCPEATYRVKGTVVNEEGQPVAGIGVGRDYSADNDEGDQGWKYLDTTDAEGSFSVIFNGNYPAMNTLYVNFDDIEWNSDGHYRDTVVGISFEGAQFTGGDGEWYAGEATRTINVTLQSAEK